MMWSRKCVSKDRNRKFCSSNHAVVDVFVTWLYTRRDPLDNTEWLENLWNIPPQRYFVAIRAYILGDELLVTRFCCAVHNAVVNHAIGYSFNAKNYLVMTKIAFDNVPENKTLLEVFVNNFCVIREEEMKDDEDSKLAVYRDELPPAFMWRVMQRLLGGD
jgi:hypothetical protein